jgi:hypothetical protein
MTMPKTVHSKPIDTPETTVVAGAIVACLLHIGGYVVLDPIDYGIALGAVLTPIAMFGIRLIVAAGKRVEEVVEDGEN